MACRVVIAAIKAGLSFHSVCSVYRHLINYFIVIRASVLICSCVSCVCQLPINGNLFRVFANVCAELPWQILNEHSQILTPLVLQQTVRKSPLITIHSSDVVSDADALQPRGIFLPVWSRLCLSSPVPRSCLSIEASASASARSRSFRLGTCN